MGKLKFPNFITAAALCSLLAGCVTEQNFPFEESKLVRLSSLDFASLESSRQPAATRDWAVVAHQKMAELLPWYSRDAITPINMIEDGHVVNVWGKMGLKPENLDSLLLNLDGIQQSAQVNAPGPKDPTLPWAEFKNMQILVTDGGMVCARLAAPIGKDLGGSYIVFTHGLFGSMNGNDVDNQIMALRRAGHHVLALEMRGHGATRKEYPNQHISFGVLESSDLLAIAHMLKHSLGAKRVGLVSFSLTAYTSIQAGWIDGGGLSEEKFAKMPLFDRVSKPDAEPAFNAGMLLVSPPADFLKVRDAFDVPGNLFNGTVRSVFQRIAAKRMEGSGVIKMSEFAKAEIKQSGITQRYKDVGQQDQDLGDFYDLSARDWREGHRRLEKVRSPMLVLEAANDPLATGQGVAELFGPVKNPNVAAIILKQGGHMGFPALSKDYYYSLMLAFFDPEVGPRAVKVKEPQMTADAHR